MPRFNLQPRVWTQITTTDKEGSIYHVSGGNVSYIEAAEAPEVYDPKTAPITMRTVLDDSFTYYRVAADNFIFAYAPIEAASITVTPAG